MKFVIFQQCLDMNYLIYERIIRGNVNKGVIVSEERAKAYWQTLDTGKVSYAIVDVNGNIVSVHNKASLRYFTFFALLGVPAFLLCIPVVIFFPIGATLLVSLHIACLPLLYLIPNPSLDQSLFRLSNIVDITGTSDIFGKYRIIDGTKNKVVLISALVIFLVMIC